MILKRIKVIAGIGANTNCYIVLDEKSKEAMVIDPGGEPKRIIEMLKMLDVKLKYIFVTHAHGDHICGIPEIKKELGGKILVHRIDAEGLYNDEINLTSYIGMENPQLESDSRIDDQDLIHVGDLEFIVIHTPGHTKGSVCLYCPEQKMIFTGDTIFRGTWGRTDLPTSSFEEIISSITDRIMVLPEDTIIYPGHGKSTMVKEEEPIYLELKPRDY